MGKQHYHTHVPLDEFGFRASETFFSFDTHGSLRRKLGSQWVPEATYSDLRRAMEEVVRHVESDQVATSNSVPPTDSSTGTKSPVIEPAYDTNDGHSRYLYPPLGPWTKRRQVDAWVEEFKRRRKALWNSYRQVPPIRCPKLGCGEPQMSSEDLKEHLYSHLRRRTSS
ncbi:hypothetical protein FS749_007304 [Ceratobasidium sp. UAMH 11750]|nr:hypothetical protein FS749_007304 [Ceratobasidium sp. UAMH 11750]